MSILYPYLPSTSCKAPSHIQNIKQISPGTCEDFSDRIFTVNQTCTEAKYVAIYNETVCSGKVLRDDRDLRICKDFKAFIRKNNKTEYWDPHNCRNSCSDPGYGCRACTNPDFFTCRRNNISVCIHPRLVCNNYQDCDNNVDEDPGMCGTNDANTILSSSFVFILSIAVMLGLNSQIL